MTRDKSTPLALAEAIASRREDLAALEARARTIESARRGWTAQSKNAALTRLHRLIRDARKALEDLSGLGLPSGAQVGNTNAVRQRPAPEPRGTELRVSLDGPPAHFLFPDRSDDEAWTPLHVVETEPVLPAAPRTTGVPAGAEPTTSDTQEALTATVDDLGMPRRGFAHPTVTWTGPGGERVALPACLFEVAELMELAEDRGAVVVEADEAWATEDVDASEVGGEWARRRDDETPSLSDLSMPSVVTFGRFVSG